MSCDRADVVLHCYFDNELDALDAAEFEGHLEQCSKCIDALETLKSLRSAMRFAQLYERSPASLRKNVLAGLRIPGTVSVMPGPPFGRRLGGWLAVAASLLLLAGIGWRAVSVHRVDNYEMLLGAEVVDAHLRSLQPGHLDDVISSDQHTVKPWFEGRLDFSPPVRDFSDRGFPLQGGRLDVIHGRAVAALVYRRRKHLVNLFVWSTNEPETSPRAGSRQCYQWLDWRKGGMELCIVSDAGPSDLDQLRRIVAESLLPL
jgi:anti-sigma factor RsiW